MLVLTLVDLFLLHSWCHQPTRKKTMSDLESKMMDAIPSNLPGSPAIMWCMGGAPRLLSQGLSGQMLCALVKPEVFQSADVTWWGRPASHSPSQFQCGLFLEVHTLEVWSASWQCRENKGLLELGSSRTSTGQLEGCPKRGSSEL